MKFRTIKINYVLALLALIVGISAAFTNHSEKNHLYPEWKYKTSPIENGKVRYISANHLADLVYNREQKVTILDLRSEAEYMEYHIPGAIHLTEPNMLSDPGASGKLVFYGKDAREKVTVFLPDTRMKMYILYGGLEEWYRIVLFPDFVNMQVRNRQTLESIINRSRYFGGQPKNIQELNITLRSSQFREGC